MQTFMQFLITMIENHQEGEPIAGAYKSSWKRCFTYYEPVNQLEYE